MASRKTEFGVVYDLTDLKASNDSTPTSTTNSSFCDINLLKQDEKEVDIITLEHNLSVLNGSKTTFKPQEQRFAYMSNKMSGADGTFASTPSIDVNFETYHSSFALTLRFVGYHPLKMRVTWWQDTSKLYTKVYTVTGDLFVVPTDIQLYNRIKFEFLETVPHSFVRVEFIKYGAVVLWDKLKIKDGKMTQDLSRVSDRLVINTLSFSLLDTKEQINFANAEGLQNYFQRNQPIYPYEIVNGEKTNLGTFFLDKFSMQGADVKMSCVSYAGLLNDKQFNEGAVYNGTKAGEVLESIFTQAGIKAFKIDEETANQPLYGTLKPQSCREALKSVLFACHSIIDASDSDRISIRKSSTIVKSKISRDIKFSTTIEKNPYISGININYPILSLEDKESEVAKGIYEEGTHKIIFSEPYTQLQIENGTIIKSAPYYVEFTSETDAEVKITGVKYVSTQNTVTAERPYIDPGQTENLKTFTTTLCNGKTARLLANKLLDYYTKNTLTLKIQHLATDTELNDVRLVEGAKKNDGRYLAWFTKRSIDLSGGFIDNAEMVGYFDDNDLFNFCGDDLYAPDNELV